MQFSKDGFIGFITLNRPPANSYELSFLTELDGAVEAAASDGDVRVVIVRSGIERFFSAGADVKAFAENTPEKNMEVVRLAHRVLDRLAGIPKVFIAQVEGHALGGGLEIALACDLRFGAEGQYRVGLPEVTLGLLPGSGGTQRLPRMVGWNRALELMLSGRTLGPKEAYELGIFERLFPAETAAEETRKYAEALAWGAWRAVTAIKQAVRQGIEKPLAEGLRLERELVAGLFATEDAREGITAFLEKRQPVFRGR